MKKTIILPVMLILLAVTACNDTYQQEPVVLTFQVADSDVTATSAKLSGRIQVLGTQNITEHGIEVYKNSITSTPIVRGFSTAATTDTFTIVFDTLNPGTLYYYQAFAKVNTTNVHSFNTPRFTTKQLK